MTFAELLTFFDRIYIAEAETAAAQDFVTGGDRIYYLYNAALELGNRLGIPRGRYSQTQTEDNATDFTLIGSPALTKIHGSVFVNGLEVAPVASFSDIMRERARASSVRHYLFDRSYSLSVLYLDYPLTDPAITFDYVKKIELSSLGTSDQPFGGFYPDYHHLVPLRAACNLWIANEEYYTSSFFIKKYNAEVAKFAIEIGSSFAIQELQLGMSVPGQEQPQQ